MSWSANRSTRIVASLAVAALALFGLTAPQATAVGGYDNAAIADRALRDVGAWGGQCRAYVGKIILEVSGGTQDVRTGLAGGDYFQSFLNAGGVRITDVNQLVKGDVVQIGQRESAANLHTFIIVGQVSGSTFQVVDSNHSYDEIVRTYSRTVTLNDTIRAYRMGTPRGGSLTDGQFVSYNGDVYRIAGGAPTYVTLAWWKTLSNPPVRTLTAPEWSSLPQYPRNGSFVVGMKGYVYVIAGGAPLYVTTWNVYGGGQPTVEIDSAAIANAGKGGVWNHLRSYPADGTFLDAHSSGSDGGGVSRVAGGAPIAVTTWNAFGGTHPVVRVDRAAVANAGNSAEPWNHLRSTPTDMFIVGSKSGRVFRVVHNGHRYNVPSWAPYGGSQPTVALDDAAIDSCDHLDCTPFGAFDSSTPVPGGVTVKGWAMDPEVTTPIGLHVYVDAKYHSALNANTARPDVDTAYHRGSTFGYSTTLRMPAGVRTVCVYGLDTGPKFRSNVELGCKTITVPAAAAPSAPAKPTGRTGNASAPVSWVAPSSDGGAKVDGYQVLATPGGKQCSTTGGLACTVTGLTNGTGYTFTVRAHNSTGWSGYSTPSAKIIPAAPAKPAPTAPAAVAVKVKAKSGKSKLWVDVNPNKGDGYWRFQVQKRRSDGTWKAGNTYRTKGSKETRTINLKKGTYRVVVHPKYGHRGATSATVRLVR